MRFQEKGYYKVFKVLKEITSSFTFFNIEATKMLLEKYAEIKIEHLYLALRYMYGIPYPSYIDNSEEYFREALEIASLAEEWKLRSQVVQVPRTERTCV